MIICHISAPPIFEKDPSWGLNTVLSTPLKISYFKTNHHEQHCWIPLNLGIKL